MKVLVPGIDSTSDIGRALLVIDAKELLRVTKITHKIRFFSQGKLDKNTLDSGETPDLLQYHYVVYELIDQQKDTATGDDQSCEITGADHFQHNPGIAEVLTKNTEISSHKDCN